MKKFVKIMLVLLCTILFSSAFGQGGFYSVYVTPDLTTNFKVSVPANSLVYVQSTDRFYNVLVEVGRYVNMTWVLADASRYDDATVAALGSTLTITDSLIVPYVDATTSVIIGLQKITQNHVNNAIFNNSLTATDTIFGGVVSSTGNLSATGITGSTLPTFTIASGQVIPTLVFDTIGFAVSGLTTASIVLCSYGEAVPTADTIACVYSVKTGWLTLMGENGKKINYWIPKK